MKKVFLKWLNAECGDWCYIIPFTLVITVITFLKMFVL